MSIITGDISLVNPERDGGDLSKSLGAIKAKGLIMPSKTDLYFPVSALLSFLPPHFVSQYLTLPQPEDSINEVQSMGGGRSKLVVIDSVWGHMGMHVPFD